MPKAPQEVVTEISFDVAFAFQTVAECVLFYYLTKKNENYKNIVRRNYRRRGRSQVMSRFEQEHAAVEKHKKILALYS